MYTEKTISTNVKIDFCAKMAQDCLQFASILQAQKENLVNQKENLTCKVEQAKKWLEKQPDFLAFLQQLQNILHQKNIGTFSQLLSYFVKDVLKKDKDVICELYTYHNLPALKIEVCNDGCRESIIDGNGGSIANIVSTGLRLIALSRMGNRKFIVLDEPDCWLENAHIPAFAKIIGEISQKLQIQTILISHHKWEYFKDYGRVIELKSDGKNLYTEIINDVAKQIPDNLDYIKSIEIGHFMSHHRTRYELSPFLNCLIGVNDIGKSVLGTALRAVAYNDSSDSYIKHFESEAQVLIETSLNKKIFWQRFKDKSASNPQKVKYSLIEKSSDILDLEQTENSNKKEQITSEFESNYVPAFIQKVLNITTVEDIDVHIGNQKQPIFILSSDIKPQQKAKILSLGKESLLIQKMMENIKGKTKLNKKILRDAEQEFTKINELLTTLGNIGKIQEESTKLLNHFKSLRDKHVNTQALLENINKIKEVDLIASIEKIGIYSPPTKLHGVEGLRDVLHKYVGCHELAQISEIKATILPPLRLRATQEVALDIRKMVILNKACEVDPINTHYIYNTLPKYKEVSEIRNLIGDYKRIEKITSIKKVQIELGKFSCKLNDIQELKRSVLHTRENNEIFAKLSEEQNQLSKTEADLEKEKCVFVKEHGESCPLCHQKIDLNRLFG